MNKLTMDDLDLQGKRVLVRVDFNVPLNEKQEITDDTRIRAALPTIRRILKQGGKAILMSHLGRPGGRVDERLQMQPVARRLGELLGQPVQAVGDCIGATVEQAVQSLQPGGCLLLENVRFHPGETANDPDFARALAGLGEVYLNDAFGTAHRAHASTEGVTHFIHPCAAGYLLQKEITYLGQMLADPTRPFVAMLGGAKIADKLGVIRRLLERVDALLIGGGMAHTFFKAMGLEIGNSIVDDSHLDFVCQSLKEAESRSLRLLLPSDCVIAESPADNRPTQVVPNTAIRSGWQVLDIGPETRKTFAEEIVKGKTLFWNGPMGVFEKPAFSAGTRAVAEALARATQGGATSIVGGGDTAAAVVALGLAEEQFSHISTGGGAALELLEGKTLPGLAALTDKEQ